MNNPATLPFSPAVAPHNHPAFNRNINDSLATIVGRRVRPLALQAEGGWLPSDKVRSIRQTRLPRPAVSQALDRHGGAGDGRVWARRPLRGPRGGGTLHNGRQQWLRQGVWRGHSEYLRGG